MKNFRKEGIFEAHKREWHVWQRELPVPRYGVIKGWVILGGTSTIKFRK